MKNNTLFEIVDKISYDDDNLIDFDECINLIRANRTYAYTKGYNQLVLVDPKYLLTGRPFGKSYEMCVWDTNSHQKIYEHTFDLHLQCTRVSKDKR